MAIARIEAEKKAREAAVARKKAREALERVGSLIIVNSNNNLLQNNGDGDGDVSAAASFFKQEIVNNVETGSG